MSFSVMGRILAIAFGVALVTCLPQIRAYVEMHSHIAICAVLGFIVGWMLSKL